MKQKFSAVSSLSDAELDAISGGMLLWSKEQCVGAFTAFGGIFGSMFGGAAGGGVGLGIGAGLGQAFCPAISRKE
ncbi:hypothetical protein GCM10023158_19810 [Gluconacetobacter tumulicola]